MRVFILGFAISVSSASLAFAADIGQYRPGTPYQSVIAQSADICESHCSGDAQCRSWNYVQPNRRMAGVCEFNATNASPVPSSVSISGTNSFAQDSASNRFNDRLVAGSTNTIRVGTQSAQVQRSAMTAPQSNRRIVREPIPQNIRPQTASTRPVTQRTNPVSLTAQQNQYRSGQPIPQQNSMRTPLMAGSVPNQSLQYPNANAVPQFKHNLGDQGVMPTPQMRQPVAPSQRPQNYNPQTYLPQMSQQAALSQTVQQPTASYRNRRHQQGPTNRQAVNTQIQMQQSLGQGQMLPNQVQEGQAYPPQSAAPQQPQNYAAPQQAWPSAAAPTMQKRTANRPMTHMDAQPSRLMQNSMPPQSPQSLAQGLTAEQAQQSLFGKLNDDVRVPSSGLNVPTDPNAPIAMSASRPMGVVEQGQLGGLVGAPRQ